LMAEIGGERRMSSDRFVSWSAGPQSPGLGVILPYDGKEATVGNGTMVALVVDSKDRVDALYAKALSLGGTDEGPPGLRFGSFYAAYFRDLDGNKLNAFYFGG
jgi:hypothetical protein